MTLGKSRPNHQAEQERIEVMAEHVAPKKLCIAHCLVLAGIPKM
ncbi:MAG: hypothetical protein JWP63_2200 [Candidatus Solibacter sp.]|nr:hypothetical protein [Candidatus Solibacter sp.]